METTRETKQPDRPFWVELAGIAAAYILIVFVFCPGNRLVGFPVHRDDFTLLSWDFGYLRKALAGGLLSRPVSTAAWTALSVAGLPAYYIALQILTILYVFLALTVSRKLLAVRQMPLQFGIVVAAAAMSLECIVEFSKYTGLITSLLAGVFGLTAMLLMATEREDQPALRAPVISAVWALSALSFWSKEDFILPTILVSFYFACEAKWTSSKSRRWFLLAGGIMLLGVLLAVYNRTGRSLYTEGSGNYQRDFNPLSIYRSGIAYLFMSPVAGIAAALQASMPVWNLIAPKPVRWTRFLLVQVLILLCLLPYCLIPRHTAFYYVFNWVVWQIGAALILLWNVSDRTSVRWAVAAIAVMCVAVGQTARVNIGNWYRNAGQVNRTVVATLLKNAEAMRPFEAVVIEGAPYLGPFESDGRFLSLRYGLDHEWIVRVPKDSDTYRTNQQLGVQIDGRVRTVAMEEVARPAGVPVLRLSPDGTGVLDLPGVAMGVIQSAARVQIRKIYPESAAAGVKFQIQPNGQSAITVQGGNFQAGAVVTFNGQDLKTTYGNPGVISALVPDEATSRVGIVKVSVRNANGEASNEVEFNVVSRVGSK